MMDDGDDDDNIFLSPFSYQLFNQVSYVLSLACDSVQLSTSALVN